MQAQWRSKPIGMSAQEQQPIIKNLEAGFKLDAIISPYDCLMTIMR